MMLNGVVIGILAGDRREQEIARLAHAHGAEVRVFGIPWPSEGIPGVQLTRTAADALRGADFALFPIPGIAPDGALFAPAHPERIIPDQEMLGGMKPNATIILGWADQNLRAHCEALNIKLDEYEWDEDLMLLRGPAIVEGMLRVLIENTDITLHKARIVSVGQGTIGTLVTRALIALGAKVDVVARNPVQRAAAYAAGAESYEFYQLPDVFAKADIVVSSVPAQIIKRETLTSLPSSALLVDLAAPPGGFDRDAIAELGLKFVWARGLGSRAPVTVGRSQWGGIQRRILTALDNLSTTEE